MRKIIFLTILVSIFCSCLALNAEWDQEWVKFVKTHNKVYKNKIEELHRRSIWEENMKKINEHNQNSKATFSMGMNKFGDLTNKEFREKFLSRPIIPKSRSASNQVSSKDFGPIPASVDWRTKGCVGPIINQGQCGSSYAFGVTASLEGILCLMYGNLQTLSAQQLVDCSTTFGNEGCNGGLFDQTYEYIKQYGLQSNKTYPYTGIEGNCVYNKSLVIASCKGEVNTTDGSEAALTAAIANIGPITVAIDSQQDSFQFYSGGVYYDPNCESQYPNHGAVAVGYGSNGTNLDYYIVKNTWGTGWGDKGFIYMSRNRNDNCGIARYGTYPLV